tara:strand:+ start:347 stop:994 length:648 start_codon:yes stop_codon:yes gene_type:complete
MFFWIEAIILASSLLGDPNINLVKSDIVDINKNSIRVYNGFESRPLMGFVLLGDIRREYHHTSISGVDFSRTLKSDFKDKPIDLSLRMSLVRYNENSYQKNHNQYNIFLNAHYKKRYNGIPVRFFLGEGISFAERIPFVEGRETRRLSGRDSKVMNYLNVGFDFRLSDLTGQNSLYNVRLGLANSHRSGAFKKIKLFNYTQGGSDFVSLFIEYDF